MKTRINDELSEAVQGLRSRGWLIEEGVGEWGTDYAHARRVQPMGIQEAMVTWDPASGLRFFALPGGSATWLEGPGLDGYADTGSLEGFTPVETKCGCNKAIRLSGLRARALARKVAEAAGVLAQQRSYRCPGNPRAHHLSSRKESSGPIPGAYVALEDGWND